MSRWTFPALIALLAGSNTVSAQPTLPSLQVLLPDGAEIIETADLTPAVAKPRTIVLWMLRPQRHAYKNQTGGDCSDIARGDFGEYREGPTRLSLIDTKQGRVVNTIDVLAGCDTCGDSFQVPVCILNSESDSAGRPNLDLKDLTGEGLKADFALVMFEAFQLVATGAFGYDLKSGMVVQYPIEIDGSRSLWTEQVFAQEPLRPGYWKFMWAPGHGDDSTYIEEVSFDRVRRVFIQKRTVSP